MDAYAYFHALSTGAVFRTFEEMSYLEFGTCAAMPWPLVPGSDDRVTVVPTAGPVPARGGHNSVHYIYPQDPGGGNNLVTEVVYAIGGGQVLDTLCDDSITNRVLRRTDFDSSSPSSWQTGGFDLIQNRQTCNTIILLDGSMLTLGGFGWETDHCEPRLVPELFKPPEIFATPSTTWAPMAPQAHERNYHSAAIMLPDGRVVSAGGIGLAADGSELLGTEVDAWFSVEVYSPTYFFHTDPRPKILGVETSPVIYDQQFDIDVDLFNSVAQTGEFRVALVAPCSGTHAVDFNQRYISLQIISHTQPTGQTTITAFGPRDGSVAPPGRYMLTVVNAEGLPSRAWWVEVGT